MTDPPGVERGTQRIGDVLLPHYLGEGCRSILPVQSHGPRVPADTDREPFAHPVSTPPAEAFGGMNKL